MSHFADHRQLLTAEAVRSQCARVTERVRNGGGLFLVNDAALDGCADHVVDVTRSRYPDLSIPYHSRWRHFRTPSATALEERFLAHLADLETIEAARVGFDLVIPSVLLDAGAGPDWAYRAPDAEEPIRRSEGLGLASLDMFLDGDFSTTGGPQTDAEALRSLTKERLELGFQVNDANPLVGVDGRLDLLRRLGSTMSADPNRFPNGRPGDLIDLVCADGAATVSARSLLGAVLDALTPVWPSGRTLGAPFDLGDAWHYPPFGSGPDAIIPFHKLSQWLTYSLAETCERSGISVTGMDDLTGLPEYRNGGLLLETGVLSLRDPSAAEGIHSPGSELIVEWRALTISLLDEIADRVRRLLDRPDMLLAEVLEGGTWAAGRVLAFERDPAGTPPLHLDSDGTVF